MSITQLSTENRGIDYTIKGIDDMKVRIKNI